MSGYQEVVTDPSYQGQLVTFTYPLIGNYGVSDHLLESAEVRSKAIVVREVKNGTWNHSCPESWIDWLAEARRGGSGWHRYQGAHQAAAGARSHERLCGGGAELDVDDLLKTARELPSMAGSDLVGAVTCSEPYDWVPEAGDEVVKPRYRVVAYDYGIKRSILRRLAAVGCSVTVVPAYLDVGAGAWPEARRRVPLQRARGSGGGGLCRPEASRGWWARCRSSASAWDTNCFRWRWASPPTNSSSGTGAPTTRSATTSRARWRSPVRITGSRSSRPRWCAGRWREGPWWGRAAWPLLGADEMYLDSDFGRAQVTHLNLNDGTVEGFQLAGAACLRGAVSPGSRPWAARQPLSLRPVHEADRRERLAAGAPRSQASVPGVAPSPDHSVTGDGEVVVETHVDLADVGQSLHLQRDVTAIQTADP